MPDALAVGRGLRLRDGALDDGAQVVGAQVEQHKARTRASTARAGSLASQSSRSICWRDCSRNSCRVASSGTWPSASSSLKVRSAAIGVLSSCDTSARKSRERSRSRRMYSIDVLDSLGHGVERRRQLAHLRASCRWRRDARVEVALRAARARRR